IFWPYLSSFGKGHAHHFQELQGFGVGLGSGDDSDIHALGAFNFIHVDLWENRLIVDPQRVVAPSVKGTDRQTTEIADAWQGRGDQAVEKLIHSLAAQSNMATDGLAFAELEIGDALAGLGHDGFAAGDET